MVEMLPKMNRINEIRADKDGPKIPKGHKKQMNIWDEGNPCTGTPPNMGDFPNDDDFSSSWNVKMIRAVRFLMILISLLSTKFRRR